MQTLSKIVQYLQGGGNCKKAVLLSQHTTVWFKPFISIVNISLFVLRWNIWSEKSTEKSGSSSLGTEIVKLYNLTFSLLSQCIRSLTVCWRSSLQSRRTSSGWIRWWTAVSSRSDSKCFISEKTCLNLVWVSIFHIKFLSFLHVASIKFVYFPCLMLRSDFN